MVRQRMHVRHTGVADAVTSVAPTAATTSRSIVIRCTMRPLGYAELSKNCTSIPVIAELSKCSTKNDFREKIQFFGNKSKYFALITTTLYSTSNAVVA